MSKQYDAAALAGRILMGVLFFMSGLSKIGAPAATIGYIAHVGLPLPVGAYALSTTVELVGGALLMAGFQARLVASVVAVFTLATALFFHNNFADQDQMIHFMKNIAIIGGLLQLVAFGAGRLSVDGLRARRSTPAEAALQPAA